MKDENLNTTYLIDDGALVLTYLISKKFPGEPIISSYFFYENKPFEWSKIDYLCFIISLIDNYKFQVRDLNFNLDEFKKIYYKKTPLRITKKPLGLSVTYNDGELDWVSEQFKLIKKGFVKDNLISHIQKVYNNKFSLKIVREIIENYRKLLSLDPSTLEFKHNFLLDICINVLENISFNLIKKNQNIESDLDQYIDLFINDQLIPKEYIYRSGFCIKNNTSKILFIKQLEQFCLITKKQRRAKNDVITLRNTFDKSFLINSRLSLRNRLNKFYKERVFMFFHLIITLEKLNYLTIIKINQQNVSDKCFYVAEISFKNDLNNFSLPKSNKTIIEISKEPIFLKKYALYVNRNYNDPLPIKEKSREYKILAQIAKNGHYYHDPHSPDISDLKSALNYINSGSRGSLLNKKIMSSKNKKILLLKIEDKTHYVYAAENIVIKFKD